MGYQNSRIDIAKTDRFLAKYLRDPPTASSSYREFWIYEEQMENLRQMYRKLRRNRTYALNNFDEFLAAASLYHFRKISKIPDSYITGIQEIDDANMEKIKYYKIYQPADKEPQLLQQRQKNLTVSTVEAISVNSHNGSSLKELNVDVIVDRGDGIIGNK